jgi:hypothetical protein
MEARFICSVCTAFGYFKSPAVLNYNILNKRWLYLGWLWRSTVCHNQWCSYLLKACPPVSAPFLHVANMATVHLWIKDNSFYLLLLKTILRAFYKTCHVTILYPRRSVFVVFIYDLFSGTVTSLDYIVTDSWTLSNGFWGIQKEVAMG